MPLRVLAARIAPSWRSLGISAALVVLAAGAYAAARETSMFAVRTVEVRGAPAPVEKDVRAALEPLAGTSLLKIDRSKIERRLAALPSVAAVAYDRAFPHTLRVFVSAERPVAVLRRGSEGWLVAASGRVLRELPRPRLSGLARVWLPRSASVTVGATLADEAGRRAVEVLAAARRMPLRARVADVVTDARELTLHLASGLEVRLGDTTNLRVKLAVANRILSQLSPPGYLDVSVPLRVVAADNSQPEG